MCMSAISNREFFKSLLGIGVSVFLAPHRGSAQQKTVYEAMLLSCIDPRIIDPVHKYMNTCGLNGKYSQFTIAGAAIAVEAKSFRPWHQTFWDNLSISIEFHKIKKVIAIDHRDCGAARIAYGVKSVGDWAAETDTHKHALLAFQKDVRRLHPNLGVETGLMALDGSVELFTKAEALSESVKKIYESDGRKSASKIAAAR